MNLIKDFEVLSEDELSKPVDELLCRLQPGDRIRLEGDLGAGKTTFVRRVLLSLGYKDPVLSPTYPLLIEYELDSIRLIHIDGFRLDGKTPDPWDSKDWKDAWIFVEWAERTRLNLNQFSYLVQIRSEAGKRRIRLFSL